MTIVSETSWLRRTVVAWRQTRRTIQVALIWGSVSAITLLAAVISKGDDRIERQRELRARNEYLREILYHHPELWNQTRTSAEEPDFAGSHLTGKKFTGLNLENAIFRNSQMEDVVFVGCNLKRSDFGGSTLKRVRFERSTAEGVILMGAVLHQVSFFDSDMRRGHFTNSDMVDVLFEGDILVQGSFGSGDFRKVTIRNADLSFANLSLIGEVSALRIVRSNMKGFLYKAYKNSLDISISESQNACEAPLDEYCR